MKYQLSDLAVEEGETEGETTASGPELAPLSTSRAQQEFVRVAAQCKRDFDLRALHLTRNAADAGDLVQRTLERGYNYLHHFELGTNMRRWLLRILVNLFLDDCRRAAAAPKMEPLVDQVVAAPVMEDRSEREPPWACITLEQVRSAVTRLKQPFREVFELRLVDKLGYDEISQRLRIPVGTVATRLLRGRRMLQEMLLPPAAEREDVSR